MSRSGRDHEICGEVIAIIIIIIILGVAVLRSAFLPTLSTEWYHSCETAVTILALDAKSGDGMKASTASWRAREGTLLMLISWGVLQVLN